MISNKEIIAIGKRIKIICNALSVSTDAILFGEITYDKEPYNKEFTDIMLDCSDNEKKYIMQAARYAKQLIHDIKS